MESSDDFLALAVLPWNVVPAASVVTPEFWFKVWFWGHV
jgi:hypothetical protein